MKLSEILKAVNCTGLICSPFQANEVPRIMKTVMYQVIEGRPKGDTLSQPIRMLLSFPLWDY